MADEKAQPEEGQEFEEHPDDLKLPEETAEEVKGGAAAVDKWPRKIDKT